MKILVIFTGGTIGSAERNGWISPLGSTKSLLIDNYLKKSNGSVQFALASPYTVLSENLCADNLNTLIKCVRENMEKGFEQMIVCHGTDTLQYSAAALSYAFSGEKLQLVFASSNYPLKNEKANGFANFEAAVEFIKSIEISGVFAAYKNGGKNAEIHNALRLVCHREADDGLYSIDGNPIASYDGHKIILNSSYCFSDSHERLLNVCFPENSGVLAVSSVPADDFSYSLNGIKAVIIRPYHSGTLDTGSKCFKEFCKRAKEKDIPVFAVNVKAEARYESTRAFDELGITVLPFCSFPAVYVKMWLAKGCGSEIKSFVERNISGEFIKNSEMI